MSDTELIQISAKELFTPERFDLMAKYAYVQYKMNGDESSFAKTLYEKHIEAFSGGSFKEPGNEDKNTLQAYLEVFDSLIQSVKENGFNKEFGPIPVNENRVIGDGAHRVATAAYFDLSVPAKLGQFDVNYNHEFFRSMYLDEIYLDYIATKYIESSGYSTHVLCLWPAALKQGEELLSKVKSILEKEKIVYQKQIELSYSGMKNLMIQLYEHFEWIGSPNDGFKGVYGKLDPCYCDHYPIEVYVLQCEDKEIIDLKARIREIFGLQNHSCHSSDNHEDALEMAHLLLNSNSIRFLNGEDFSFDSKLINRMISIRDCINEKRLNSSHYIIDSSSILGILGIRKTEDVDYISIDDEKLIGFDNHEDYLPYYGLSKKDLIFDPQNYGYVFGIKIISLEVLERFKKNRGEEKDLEDLVLIHNYLDKEKSIKDSFRGHLINLKRSLRNAKTSIRDYLEDHNITVFTKLWHLLVGKGFK